MALGTLVNFPPLISKISTYLETSLLGFVVIEAAWFGLIAGFLESAFLAALVLWRGSLVNRPEEFVWMIPFTDLVVMIVVALILLALSVLWKNILDQRILVTVFSTLAGMSLYFTKPKVTPIAAIILVLGISINLAILANKHFPRFRKIVIATFPWLMILFGLDVLLSYLFL